MNRRSQPSRMARSSEKIAQPGVIAAGRAAARDETGRISQFERGESAAVNGISLGLIRNVYSDAIEYTAISAGMRGMVMLAGLSTAAFGTWGSYFILAEVKNRKFGFSLLPVIFCAILFVVFSAHFSIKFTRLELWRPEDEPTIFDRKNRKVYRIYREVYAGWHGLVAPWPMKTAEYDWDLIDAEHHAAVTTTGSTVSRQHGLIFIVRTSATDSTPIDSFAIGNSMLMGEVTVPAVWEHIRRFMEEGGPHLPPGEVLRQAKRPATFWQCMASTGPYGANFRIWWREQTALMILGLIFFPIVFPLMTLLGVFSWLSYKTSIPIQWSPSVRAAIGE